MRSVLVTSTFVAALFVSAPAHALIDCWAGMNGGTICEVLSAMGTAGPSSSQNEWKAAYCARQRIACEDAQVLLQDYCPMIEDARDGTDDDFLLCGEVSLLVEDACTSPVCPLQ